MRTLYTIPQQKDWLADNRLFSTLQHKWSSRGQDGGNSKIILNNDDTIAKASGCGYDRYGTVLGDAIEHIFPKEVLKLAKKYCKLGKRGATRKGSKDFYGMFYNAKNKTAHLDGGCGSQCMSKILNKIGFSIEWVGESDQSNSGVVFYKIIPITKNQRAWLKG